jgi:hypothetical protein
MVRGRILIIISSKEVGQITSVTEMNGDCLNNIRCEASRKFRNNEAKYLKDKINEFATNGKTINTQTCTEE